MPVGMLASDIGSFQEERNNFIPFNIKSYSVTINYNIIISSLYYIILLKNFNSVYSYQSLLYYDIILLFIHVTSSLSKIYILGRCKHRGGEPSLRCSLTSMYTLYIVVKPDSNDWMKGSKEYQNLNGMKREAA